MYPTNIYSDTVCMLPIDENISNDKHNLEEYNATEMDKHFYFSWHFSLECTVKDKCVFIYIHPEI